MNKVWKEVDYTGNLGNWGFKKKLGKQKSFDQEWKEYEETGIWKGYEEYVIPLLDATYIEQMANAFASKYKIKVQSSKNWSIDIEKKILFYDPASLMRGTKGALIACLLHEIGHLRHTTAPKILDSPYLKKYKIGAFTVLNLFEDFRIDDIMKKSYEGAEDVFEELKPLIKTIAEGYAERSIEMRREIQKIVIQYGSLKNPLHKMKLRKLIKKLKEQDTLFDYMNIILLKGYDEDVEIPKGKMKKRIKKTEPAIKKSISLESTPRVLTMLDKKVFPVIKDLLKDMKEGSKELQGLIGEAGAKDVMKEALRRMGITASSAESSSPRTVSKGTDQDIPEEWRAGKYEPLKRSVERAIRELIRELTFLKRREQAQKWSTNKTRGKLNVKSIYKFPANNPRLFKKKEENQDTISSFAFSFLIDVSGSMAGERIIHTTRGLIILTEVFKKLKIPFEVIAFDTSDKKIKSFDDNYDKRVKNKIASISIYTGGGTLLRTGLKAMELERRTERNRILIILSDGGDNESPDYYTRYFDKFKKQRIKTIGIGIGSSEIARYCKKVIEIADVDTLPKEFSKLLKQLLLKGRKKI